MKITLAEPQAPGGSIKEDMHRLAFALQTLVGRNLSQWAMLTPIWIDENSPEHPAARGPLVCRPAPAHPGQRRPAPRRGVDRRGAGRGDPGHRHHRPRPHRHGARVEAARPGGHPPRHPRRGADRARPRRPPRGAVSRPDPCMLPRPDTPLLDLVRWARGIEGSIVVLVHPLPGLWRGQLRAHGPRGAAARTRSSPASRSAASEPRPSSARPTIMDSPCWAAATRTSRRGRSASTRRSSPGETADDLIAALRARQTRAVTYPSSAAVCRGGYTSMQSLYSWLLPMRAVPGCQRYAVVPVAPGQKSESRDKRGRPAATGG